MWVRNLGPALDWRSRSPSTRRTTSALARQWHRLGVHGAWAGRLLAGWQPEQRGWGRLDCECGPGEEHSFPRHDLAAGRTAGDCEWRRQGSARRRTWAGEERSFPRHVRAVGRTAGDRERRRWGSAQRRAWADELGQLGRAGDADHLGPSAATCHVLRAEPTCAWGLEQRLGPGPPSAGRSWASFTAMRNAAIAGKRSLGANFNCTDLPRPWIPPTEIRRPVGETTLLVHAIGLFSSSKITMPCCIHGIVMSLVAHCNPAQKFCLIFSALSLAPC